MFNLYIAPRQAIITFQNRISLSRYKPRETQNKDPGSNDHSKIDQIDQLNDILDTVTFLPFTLQRLRGRHEISKSFFRVRSFPAWLMPHECIWKVLSLRWKLFLLEDRETGKFFPSENFSASRSFQLCYRTRRIPL